MDRKLDFAVAGVQKGGTTTLAKLLRHHPRIQMASVKETHFFDDEGRDWSISDYEALHARFPADDERLRGEATPITLYWKPAIRRMQTYNPDLKLILLLRDPVERAYSSWKHVYGMGRDSMPFSQAIREGRERVRNEPETEGLHRLYSYVERGQYAEQLAHLTRYFPRAQIHCDTTEAFVEDQSAGLARIAAFLRIDDFPDGVPILHENRARDLDYPSELVDEDIAYLREIFAADIKAARDFYGAPLRGWTQ